MVKKNVNISHKYSFTCVGTFQVFPFFLITTSFLTLNFLILFPFFLFIHESNSILHLRLMVTTTV